MPKAKQPEYVRPWCVYTHATLDGRPIYIGKGKLSRARCLAPSRRTAYHLNAIKKHCGQVLIIAVQPFETEAEAFAAEKIAIAEARAAGHQLCNFTDGGEGATGAVKSPETIEKLRQAAIRQWDRQGRAPKKLLASGVSACVSCGADIQWVKVPRKVCSKRCESAHYRKPYVPSARKLPASGVRGVYPTKHGKWKAAVTRDKRVCHLGTFDTKEAAAEAVRSAK